MNNIEKHEKAIEILEAINHFNSMIKLNQETIDGAIGKLFPELVAKYTKEISIHLNYIKRLEERYEKLIKTL